MEEQDPVTRFEAMVAELKRRLAIAEPSGTVTLFTPRQLKEIIDSGEDILNVIRS